MPLYVAQLSVLFLNWQRQGIVNLFKEELRMQSVGNWNRVLINELPNSRFGGACTVLLRTSYLQN